MKILAHAVKNLSIKWKILIGAFAVFFFTIFISDGVFLYTIYKTLSYRNYVNDERLADSLIPELAYSLHYNKSSGSEYIKKNLLYDIKNYKIIKGIGLYNDKGKLTEKCGSLYGNYGKTIAPNEKNNKNRGNHSGLINVIKNMEVQFTLMGTNFYGYKGYRKSSMQYPVLIKKIEYGRRQLGFASIEFNLKKEIKSTDNRVFWVGIRFMSIALFFVTAGLIIFYYISSIVTNPLSDIKENIKKIKEGDYDISFYKRFNDEIGDVMDALSSMALSIKKYISEVESINKEKNELNCMAVMGELSANIAHEVKNAIYVISSANEYISQETKNKIVLEFTGIINKEVKRLNKMSVEFLSFAKQRNPVYAAVDINKLLEDSIRILKFEAANSKIKLIQKSIDYSLPPVQADAEMLKQVILNLIINAIDKKYRTDKKLIEIKAFSKDNRVNIEIADNGEPISAENIKKIFNPFFTTKNSGSGLGLPISLRIVKLHGGSIKVSSEEGKTVFTIIIPAGDAGKIMNN
ncbi:MAG: ATP-binding protein [Deltaproteobacteria bacterium]|nr:ATP-binding protein [Deltaproteobacteria bacterium]